MEPGFKLNLHDRDQNPCFESHDPSMMYDPVSGMYYSYSTDAALTSVYRQGIPVRRSRDLVHFTFVGYALSDRAVAQGRDNGPKYRPTSGFWAPYVEYAEGEYRMYYSATRVFGSSESRIWLAVMYHPGTGFYYLFLSYGWLGDDYDIRVGRSRRIIGPYLDYGGRSLDGEGWGLKLAGSYCFRADDPWAEDGQDWKFAGFRGPGHGAPFYDPVSEQYFFVHHVRDGAESLRRKDGDRDSFRMHYMTVRRMFFLDGWPVFSPQPYAGEKGGTDSLREYMEREGIKATQWEWLRFKERDNRPAMAVCAPLPGDLPPERAVTFTCFDFENSRVGQALTGITTGGETIWGKRYNAADLIKGVL